MISTDQKDRKLTHRQLIQEIIEQRNRLDRRNCLVIHIPRDNDAIWLFLIHAIHDLTQNIFLIVDHGKPIDPLSKMQIR